MSTLAPSIRHRFYTTVKFHTLLVKSSLSSLNESDHSPEKRRYNHLHNRTFSLGKLICSVYFFFSPLAFVCFTFALLPLWIRPQVDKTVFNHSRIWSSCHWNRCCNLVQLNLWGQSYVFSCLGVWSMACDLNFSFIPKFNWTFFMYSIWNLSRNCLSVENFCYSFFLFNSNAFHILVNIYAKWLNTVLGIVSCCLFLIIWHKKKKYLLIVYFYRK